MDTQETIPGRLPPFPCEPFNASRRPTTESNQELYANLRAEAYARFRTKLIKGEVSCRTPRN